MDRPALTIKSRSDPDGRNGWASATTPRTRPAPPRKHTNIQAALPPAPGSTPAHHRRPCVPYANGPRASRHVWWTVARLCSCRRLPSPCAKFSSEPSHEITQERGRIITRIGSGSGVADSHDHGLSGVDRASLAQKVESRPSVLNTRPHRLLVHVASSAASELAALLGEVPGRSDEVDCRVQLLITEPALMFLTPLKPGSRHHTTKPDQSTDQDSQKVRHTQQSSQVRGAEAAPRA